MNRIMISIKEFTLYLLIVLNIVTVITICRKSNRIHDLEKENKILTFKNTKEQETLNYTISSLMRSVEMNGEKINNSIVCSITGLKIDFYSLISDTCIIYNFTENGCQVCMTDELERIRTISVSSKKKIICITNFENFREFKAFVNSNGLTKFDFYNATTPIINDKFHVIIHTDTSKLVKKCFQPDKIYPELNEWFSNLISNN